MSAPINLSHLAHAVKCAVYAKQHAPEKLFSVAEAQRGNGRSSWAYWTDLRVVEYTTGINYVSHVPTNGYVGVGPDFGWDRSTIIVPHEFITELALQKETNHEKEQRRDQMEPQEKG